MKNKAKFIVIDGCEGAGKTTMVKKLLDILPAGICKVTHEPGGSAYAEEIRQLILYSPHARTSSAETQFGLQWAQRADHLKNFVIPTLNAGVNVITDRFDSSTFAYQIFGQEAKQLKKLFFEMRKVYLRECKPDLYVFFDVEPEEGLRRVALRKEQTTHFDERRIEFHKRVRKGFWAFLKTVPHVIIDANQSPDLVEKDFLAQMKKALRI